MKEAKPIGLVNKVAAADELEATGMELERRLANDPPAISSTRGCQKVKRFLSSSLTPLTAG